MLTSYCRYEYDCGDVLLYKNGLLHCEHGPAITTSDGYELWYLNGKLHRRNGPAYIGPEGRKEYWLGGYQYDEHRFIEVMTRRMYGLEDSIASIESSRNCLNAALLIEMRRTARLRHRAFAVRKRSLFWRGLANKCADIGVALMKENTQSVAASKEVNRTLYLVNTKTCLRCRKDVGMNVVYSGLEGPYCSSACAVS